MLYIPFIIRPLLGVLLFASSCSPADNSQNETAADQPQTIAQAGKKGKKGKTHRAWYRDRPARPRPYKK